MSVQLSLLPIGLSNRIPLWRYSKSGCDVMLRHVLREGNSWKVKTLWQGQNLKLKGQEKAG